MHVSFIKHYGIKKMILQHPLKKNIRRRHNFTFIKWPGSGHAYFTPLIKLSIHILNASNAIKTATWFKWSSFYFSLVYLRDVCVAASNRFRFCSPEPSIRVRRKLSGWKYWTSSVIYYLMRYLRLQQMEQTKLSLTLVPKNGGGWDARWKQ